MLHALASWRSTRTVWWLHTTNGPTTHALAEEARRLVDSLPAGRSQVFYTSDAVGPAETGVTCGRVDRAALAELGLPTEASAYVCGPTGFMDAMTAALAGSTPLLSGAVTYSPKPLTEPDTGDVLLCCARPDVDVVLGL